MGENEINAMCLQQDMREVVIFRLQPPMARYFVSAKPQNIARDGLKAYGTDEQGLVAVLRKIGYEERELTNEVMARLLYAFHKDVSSSRR